MCPNSNRDDLPERKQPSSVVIPIMNTVIGPWIGPHSKGGGYEFDRLASVGVQELDRPLSPLPRKCSLLRLIFVGICLEEAMQQWAFPTSAQDHSRKEGFF